MCVCVCVCVFVCVDDGKHFVPDLCVRDSDVYAYTQENQSQREGGRWSGVEVGECGEL